MKHCIPCILVLLLFAGCQKADMSGTSFQSATGQGGSMARFTVVGNYLYTVDKELLKVFDITNPAAPVFKRSTAVGFEIETIFPFQDRLFIGSTSVVHIFSIADPANPQKMSIAFSPTVMRRCDPVVAKDSVAYATLRATGPCGGTRSILAVYDIRNIAAPVERFAYTLSEPYGLGYSGNVLYVCDKVQGLLVLDISNAYQPAIITSIKDGEYIDVIPYGNLLVCWVKDGLMLYDISDKKAPQLITHIE